MNRPGATKSSRPRILPAVSVRNGLLQEPDATAKHKNKQPQTRATLSSMSVLPELNSAIVMDSYSIGEQDLGELVIALRKNGDAVGEGDLSGAERMLTSQAHALDAMFVKLARRAVQQDGLPQMDAMLKFALRAQSQCRATLETLATIKNPPVVFAKQANIAQNQQVNNGDAAPIARAAETEKPQTEQWRLTHDRQSLDFGTPAQAIGSDTALATMGEIDGPEDRGR